jgi:hypothetical protein
MHYAFRRSFLTGRGTGLTYHDVDPSDLIRHQHQHHASYNAMGLQTFLWYNRGTEFSLACLIYTIFTSALLSENCDTTFYT